MNKHICALIEATERVFHCPPGAITNPDRTQPVISFRQLAMLLAYEAGYRHSAISEAFGRDHRTVANNIFIANGHLRANRAWWLNAKADLYDAWQEAIGGD